MGIPNPASFDPPEGVVLSDREEQTATMRAVAKLLTRGRPRFGQCSAKRIVDEAWNEGQTAAELDAITDLCQWGAERGEWDYAELGKILAGMVMRYASACVDQDKAVAEMLESAE